MWFGALITSFAIWLYVAYQMAKSPTITIEFGKKKREITSRWGKTLWIFLLLPIFFVVIWIMFALIWIIIAVLFLVMILSLLVSIFKSGRK